MQVERCMRQDGKLGIALVGDDGSLVDGMAYTTSQARIVVAALVACADQIDFETLGDLDPEGLL